MGKNKTKGGCALRMLSSNERGGSGSKTESTRCPDGVCAGHQHLKLQRKFRETMPHLPQCRRLCTRCCARQGRLLIPRHTLSRKTAFWAWFQPGAGAHWRESISCSAG